MKAIIGQQTVDAWCVTHTEDEAYEEWVQHYFDNGTMMWHPRHPEQLRFSLMFGGQARVGDYLIQNGPSDLKVVSPKKFAKEYRIVKSDE